MNKLLKTGLSYTLSVVVGLLGGMLPPKRVVPTLPEIHVMLN